MYGMYLASVKMWGLLICVVKLCSPNVRNNDGPRCSEGMTNDTAHITHYCPSILVWRCSGNINICIYFSSVCSTNRDHPLQGLRRQVQRRPLRGHHVWGLQGGTKNISKTGKYFFALLICRDSSGGRSLVLRTTSARGRRTAWWTEWTETGVSSADSRSAWPSACPEMVSTLQSSFTLSGFYSTLSGRCNHNIC